MKESSWNECLENNNAIEITKDTAKAKSLIEIAKARIKFLEGNRIDGENSIFIFEGHYSSALELLHALVLLKGFKVINHVCIGHYIKDVLKRKDLFRIFDDIRIKRNFLLYYGKKMEFETAKASIEKIKTLIAETEKLIEYA